MGECGWGEEVNNMWIIISFAIIIKVYVSVKKIYKQLGGYCPVYSTIL